MDKTREYLRGPGKNGEYQEEGGQGQGGLESDREVWTGPGRIGEGQGMVKRGGECQGGVVRAMEG